MEKSKKIFQKKLWNNSFNFNSHIMTTQFYFKCKNYCKISNSRDCIEKTNGNISNKKTNGKIPMIFRNESLRRFKNRTAAYFLLKIQLSFINI